MSILRTFDEGAVSAIIRRFSELSVSGQAEALARMSAVVGAAFPASAAEQLAFERAEALAVMRLVAGGGTRAPSCSAFNASPVAREHGWTSRRVSRAFGRWRFAADAYEGKDRVSAATRSVLRESRRGVWREREDYLRGLRLWLATNPRSMAAVDYDGWRRDHNAARPAHEPPLVSYSRLRQVFDCSWNDLLDVAQGLLPPESAGPRPSKLPRPRLHGPHNLIGLAEVREILGLGLTAARNRTYAATFPPPAYTQPRGARTRLWRRSDVLAYTTGTPLPAREPNDLQDLYMDVRAVAATLGLAPITVTTRSSPRVPVPAAAVAGLQLWLRADVNETLAAEDAKTR